MLSLFYLRGRVSFATPWTAAHQTPLSMGFPRQEYWSGWPFPPPGDLPDPGMNSYLLHWQVDSFTTSHLGSPFQDLPMCINYWSYSLMAVHFTKCKL